MKVCYFVFVILTNLSYCLVLSRIKLFFPCHTGALAEVSIKLRRGFFAFLQKAQKWQRCAVIVKWQSAFSLSVIASEQSKRGNPQCKGNAKFIDWHEFARSRLQILAMTKSLSYWAKRSIHKFKVRICILKYGFFARFTHSKWQGLFAILGATKYSFYIVILNFA